MHVLILFLVKQLLFLLLGCLTLALGVPASAQERLVTISGYIDAAESQETLLGATVYAPQSQQGTQTNSHGFFSLRLPVGTQLLRFSFVGYEAQEHTFELTGDTTLSIHLRPLGELSAVTVTGERRKLNLSKLGVLQVPVEIVKRAPSLFGESDLMKALQLMPGVQAGSEGSAGVHVRGGGPDENLILLDGVSLYNVDHLMGFFSVFTPEAVKQVDLYKGSFPARYGGRLSSVIDVRTNDGDLSRYHGSLQIGLLSSKLQLEGPLVKERTSFNLSIRRTYADLLIRPFLPKDEQVGYYFYDIYGKLQHRLSGRDRLFLSVYHGRDALHSDIQDKEGSIQDQTKGSLAWGNTLGALRWTHIFTPRLYSDLTLAYTRYHFFIDSRYSERSETFASSASSRYKSGIEDLSLGWHLHHHLTNSQQFRYGLDYIYHRFRPEAMSSYSRYEAGSAVQEENLPDLLGKARVLPAQDLSAYIESRTELGALQVDAGLRTSLYSVEGKGYLALQPRLSLGWHLTPDWLLQTAYARMSQSVHLLTSATMTLPSDLWVPATKHIRPMTSDQVSLGLTYQGLPGWSFSLEGYYKQMNHVLEYKDGASFLGRSSGWEDKVEMGLGRAYGLEAMLMRQVGKTTGWLGYTWAHSERRFSQGQINGGQWFPYKYDRRHHINLVVSHRFSSRLDLSASWEYFSGGVITLASERMALPLLTIQGGSSFPSETNYVERRNNYRLPATHRLNLSANFRRRTRRGHESIWNVSLYNAYNQMNPAFITPKVNRQYDANGRRSQYLTLEQYTILPILPSVSYTYKF